MSSLNPNAPPYIPIFKNPSLGDSGASNELVGVSAKSEYVGKVARCQFPDGASLEHKSLEELHVSNKSSSEMVLPPYSYNSPIRDERFGAEKQSMMNETNIVIDFLVSRFPSYSAESLADFLKRLDDTIDFLEELEDSHDGVHVESSATSEIRHGAGPTKQLKLISRFPDPSILGLHLSAHDAL